MNYLRQIALPCAALLVAAAATASDPVFHHSFKSATDDSGKYAGQLVKDARLRTLSGINVLNLGSEGYFDFGEAMGSLIASLSGDFSIATALYIPEDVSLGENGNFVFNFGNSSSDGYMFFSAKDTRYSITPTNWSGEQTVSVWQNLPKGEWLSIAVVREGDDARMYLNGELLSTAQIPMHPADLGKTPQNWLGRSPYDGDKLLDHTWYYYFSIYDTAISDAEVKALANDENLAKLAYGVAENAVQEVIATYPFDFSEVRADINLPTSFANGVTGTWSSSDESFITPSGKVTRPAVGKADAELTLTLTARKGDVVTKKDYPAKVLAELTDEEAIEFDLSGIELPGNKDNLRSLINLPSVTKEGSKITWFSDKEDYLTPGGRVLRLSPAGGDKVEVKLTAVCERNGKSNKRVFTTHIACEEEYDSYLFAFFPNNDDENLYYALSTDGFNYKVLNNDQMVLDASQVALKKGIRDPYVTRGEDGRFYMVATDMKCADGWDSNRGLVMLHSDDLVTWTSHTVNFPTRFPEWSAVTHVWAPEVIWDKDYKNADGSKGRYMVYFSLLTTDGKCPYDKLYYCYANDDFSDLITEPEYLYDRGSATIDADIVYNDADSLYHMFYKNEGEGGICQVTAKTLLPEEGMPAGSQWGNPSGTLQQTTEAVEGAGIFRLINTDTWVLMYDCYCDGHYQFCTSSDLNDFALRAQTNTTGAFTPRHGSVLPLLPEETALLMEKFPATFTEAALTGARNPLVRQDRYTYSFASKKVYVPVMPGTDLKAFDPMFGVSLGATVEPEGPQDFSDGNTVVYSVTNGQKVNNFKVTAAVEANPVLPGFCADPEVLYSHKTGRFYIYPTTDGIGGWGGHTFNVYSSADLVNWNKETCILDLATDDVVWATGNAWAPSIEEKLCDDGRYRYYFYFSGHNPEKNYKTLGCAVAESPVGPFYDLGKPMIDVNVADGQLIDSDVFTDPVSGDSFFYWGNGNLVASRLGADMTTVSDAKNITPAGGTLDDYAFREGVYVFYREGKYYFLWSVDDTGARNYHVAYGTSDSPMGPITVASDPIVIKQDAGNEIYGTGHNSILQIPGRDEWYIVYHRINKNYVSKDPGIHREVCIDRLEFNADGTIQRVTPTHKGIDPVLFGQSSVDQLESEMDVDFGTPVSTFYYDFGGLYLGTSLPTDRGLYIKVNLYGNGRVRASKIAVP